MAALLLPLLLTLTLDRMRGTLNLTSEALLFLVAVVGVACIGGVVSALIAALTAALLLNYWFMAPVGEFTMSDPDSVLALVVFAVVAATVAAAADRSLRLSRRAAGATAEAETMSSLAGSIIRGDQTIPALLERTRETFSMDTVELTPEPPDIGPGTESGRPARREAGPALAVAAGHEAFLVLRGRTLPSSERRVLAAFAAHVGAAVERARLAEAAAEVEPIKAADRLRTALLRAVSHDLRTPLAGALASVSSLRNQEVEVSAEDRAELLESAEVSLNRLNRLVENLLDLSRLQAGALTLGLRATTLEEVLPAALESLDLTPGSGPAIDVQNLESVSALQADPPLLERVLANLVGNAVRHAPADRPVLVTASALAGRVDLSGAGFHVLDAGGTSGSDPAEVEGSADGEGGDQGEDGPAAEEVHQQGEGDRHGRQAVEPGEGGLTLAAGEAGHGQQPDKEADEDRHRVEEDQFLLLPRSGHDDHGGCGQVDEDGPVRRVVAVRPAQHRREDARVVRRPGEGLEESGAGLERGAGGGQEQQRTGDLEGPVEPAGAGGGMGDVGDLGGVLTGDANAQAYGEHGQGQGEAADDDQEKGERTAPEAATVAVVELAELSDGRGRRLDAGGQGHRDGEGEDDCEGGGAARVGRGGGLTNGVGRNEAVYEYGDADEHEEHGHDGEQQPPAVSEPGQPGDDQQQEQGERDTEGCGCGEEGNHGTGGGRDGNPDGQDEVDDECADRYERPARPEGPPCRRCRPTSLGEAAHQLPVVGGDHDDQAHDQRHGRQQQGEVAVQGTQRRLNGVRHGGDGVCDHSEGEREEEDRAARAPTA